MADLGKIHKTFEMYVDKETASEAIGKGYVVCWGGSANAKIKLADTDYSQLPPYGVALEAATADADTLLVAWRGVVEVSHDVAADDVLQKNQPVCVSSTTSGKVIGWTTALADDPPGEWIIVGHTLEAASSTTAEVKVMLGGVA
jgi:hypothetical protein